MPVTYVNIFPVNFQEYYQIFGYAERFYVIGTFRSNFL